jgi:hypothetical protein
MRDANTSFRSFTSRLSSSPGLSAQQVSSTQSDLSVYPSLPLLNFLGLLLLAVEKGSADLFKQLRSHYAQNIKELGAWDESLDLIAEMYFGIQRPRQGNPLFDMMGSMFGMPNMQPKKKETKRVGTNPSPPAAGPTAPVAEGLD